MDVGGIIGAIFGMALLVSVGLLTDRISAKRGWGRWRRIFFMVAFMSLFFTILSLLLVLIA